jgi:1,4-alpha-glucan branching enzyme
MIRKEQNKKEGNVKVTFILPKEEISGRVSVVGDFNEWNPETTKLVKRSNGTYSASIKLETGKHYGFRYFTEDGTWKNDDAADELAPNPFGTRNSVVLT